MNIRLSSLLVAALCFVSAGYVAAQKTAEPDPLAEWQYPQAKVQEESNGERLAQVPLHGIHSVTTAPLETVFLFYRKKCEPHFVANQSNVWRPASQFAMLMTQFAQGGESATFFSAPRKDADCALLIVHQAKRTITIQLSRDPQDTATTDIFLVADQH